METRSNNITGRKGHSRLLYLSVLIVVIAAGLVLRLFGYDAHLPYFLVKYGGSVFWGAMVYLLLGFIIAEGRPTRIALSAMGIAVAVELFRLYHTPWLDAFRMTIAGSLLLGRIFSIGNIVAYWIGIGLVWIVARRQLRRHCDATTP